jgi:hypothetical protein
MTQEDKQILLQDLCARLPYEVKVKNVKNNFDINTFNHNAEEIKFLIEEYDIKPYLRPMSNMTEGERHKIQEILGKDVDIFDDFINIIDSSRKRFSFLELQAVFDWLNAHHFDYRNLIKRSLAIEAPRNMYAF